MTKSFNPTGPYYIEIACDHVSSFGVEQIDTCYIDGFKSQDEAWEACENLQNAAADAISVDGETVSVAPSNVLQMLIAKIADDPALAIAAE